MPISLAHKLSKQLAKVRKEGILTYLRPDGKSQVTVEYDGDDRPVRVEAVVVSTQHDSGVTLERIREDIQREVIRPIIPEELMDQDTKIYVNPTGRFVVGGPVGDSGLTGRKIIVDTYGGYSRHGGGAFSGKDPTKVDRSAAYAARWVAKKSWSAPGWRENASCSWPTRSAWLGRCRCGWIPSVPASLTTSFLRRPFKNVFDLRPAAIIRALKLRQPIYRSLAAYGHMGREDLGVEWEKLNRVDELKAEAAKLA